MKFKIYNEILSSNSIAVVVLSEMKHVFEVRRVDFVNLTDDKREQLDDFVSMIR